MAQSQSKHRPLKPLFTTRSGIEVKQMQEVASQYNLLVKYNRSGLILLNGRPITHKEYHSLLVTLELEHPDACVYANAYQAVFVYSNEEGAAC